MPIQATHGEIFESQIGSGAPVQGAGHGCIWQPLENYPQPASGPQLGVLVDYNGGTCAFDLATGATSEQNASVPFGPQNYVWYDGAKGLMAKPGFNWVTGKPVAGDNPPSFLYTFFPTGPVE